MKSRRDQFDTSEARSIANTIEKGNDQERFIGFKKLPEGCTVKMFGKRYLAKKVNGQKGERIKNKINKLEVEGDKPKLVFFDLKSSKGKKRNLRAFLVMKRQFSPDCKLSPSMNLLTNEREFACTQKDLGNLKQNICNLISRRAGGNEHPNEQDSQRNTKPIYNKKNNILKKVKPFMRTKNIEIAPDVMASLKNFPKNSDNRFEKLSGDKKVSIRHIKPRALDIKPQLKVYLGNIIIIKYGKDSIKTVFQ